MKDVEFYEYTYWVPTELYAVNVISLICFMICSGLILRYSFALEKIKVVHKGAVLMKLATAYNKIDWIFIIALLQMFIKKEQK